MKTKTFKFAALCALLFSVFCLSIQPVLAAEGTDGSELQLLQAEQLEIQLGAEWSGVEFQLKTDAGLYPGVITVGSDGVLRLEIGGSSFYTLSAAGSDVAVPTPTQAPATQESHESEAPEEDAGTAAGIPALHIVLFAGGLALASAVLIAMHISKRRAAFTEDESDEEE